MNGSLQLTRKMYYGIADEAKSILHYKRRSYSCKYRRLSLLEVDIPASKYIYEHKNLKI